MPTPLAAASLPVQPFRWEAVLVLFLVGMSLLVWARVRRRRAFAPPAADVELPRLDTPQRVTATLRRTFRDPAQGLWLAVAEVGKARYTFCAVDYAENAGRYEELLGKGRGASVALFALATLAPGGVEAIRHQIKDADKLGLRPDAVLLTPAGQFANDHAVVARVRDVRDDAWGEMPLRVYRADVVRGEDRSLTLDLAVPRDAAAAAGPFAPETLVHGSARLFGYLAP